MRYKTKYIEDVQDTKFKTLKRMQGLILKNVHDFPRTQKYVCFNKEKKKTLTLVSCDAVFHLTWLTNKCKHYLKFDLLGHTYSMFPRYGRWLFHVHGAMKHLNHAGMETKMFFSDPVLSASIDWRTGGPSLICICVVLIYFKRNWMIRHYVCFIIRFFIWVQWDHVETMYSRTNKTLIRAGGRQVQDKPTEIQC